MGGRLASVSLLVLVVGSVVAGSALASMTVRAERVDGVDAATTGTTDIERDSVFIRVDVAENGTARWRIEYRTRLDDPNVTAAFGTLQRDIRSNRTAYSRSFFDGIRGTIAAAENATGREMSGTNFGVESEVRRLPRTYGVVVYRFTWHGFATVTGDRIRVGDALSGFFLDRNERMLVSWPSGYELAEVRPPADARRNDAVVWRGPVDFGPSEPRMEMARSTGFARHRLGIVLALVALTTVVGGFWGLYRRRGTTPLQAVRRLASDDGPTDDPDPELLSNEERVVDVLERHGGRAKQQAVVEELGWTEAKTSQVVTRLREDGTIESFRLGRENVLSLADDGD